MNKITSKARVTEIAALADKLLRRYASASSVANDQFLKTQFEQLERLYNDLNEAIKRTRAQSNVEEKDIARDDAVRAFSHLIDGYTFIPLPEKKEAALALKAIFDKYGKQIVSESYDNESALIDSLLNDLEAKEAKAEIAKLEGMEAAVAEMRKTQTEFKLAEDEWDAAKNVDSKALSASAATKPIVLLINDKIVSYLTAMYDNPLYTNFADQVDQEIVEINGAVGTRSKKA